MCNIVQERGLAWIKKYIPMNGYIVWDMVNHLNHNPITFPCHQARSWEFPIHTQNVPCVAQSSDVQVLDLYTWGNKQLEKLGVVYKLMQMHATILK